MKSMFHPEKDLKGATPETLAKALLRSRSGVKPVISEKLPEKKVASDRTDDHVLNPRKRV